MTPAAGLLIRAHSLGARVEANGPKLRVIPPAEVDPRDWAGLVEGLAEFKAEVIQELSGSSSWSSPACPAFVFDESLTITTEECRAVVEETRRYHS